MTVAYECQRCTACCRWPGEVRVTDKEVTEIALFLGLTSFDFIQQYTRLRRNRQGLALKDKENEECIFLENGGCAVQPVKPQQCRDFPNVWSFPDFQKTCRAVAKAQA